MRTDTPLTKRIEIHYDKLVDRQIIEFIEMHPSMMSYIKDLIAKDYRKYKRNPSQYKKIRGLI